MIYIASPYTHPDPCVREYRYHCVERYTAECLRNGEVVFSPIAHSHNMAVRYDLPHQFEFWMELDEQYMLRCEKIRVLKLTGWKESKGVSHEIQFAHDNSIPVEYVEGQDALCACK